MIYPNGLTTTYGYDNLNRLTSVETRNLLNEIVASYAYTLNSKGQRTHVEEGFGGAVLRTIDYVYDDADRLTEEQIADTVLGNRTITYTGACPEPVEGTMWVIGWKRMTTASSRPTSMMITTA